MAQGQWEQHIKTSFVCLYQHLNSESIIVSVMSERSHRFLVFNQYSRELMYLAQGHKHGDASGGANLGLCDLESDDLPHHHQTPQSHHLQ